MRVSTLPCSEQDSLPLWSLSNQRAQGAMIMWGKPRGGSGGREHVVGRKRCGWRAGARGGSRVNCDGKAKGGGDGCQGERPGAGSPWHAGEGESREGASRRAGREEGGALRRNFPSLKSIRVVHAIQVQFLCVSCAGRHRNNPSTTKMEQDRSKPRGEAQCSRGTALYFWGEAPPNVHGFVLDVKQEQQRFEDSHEAGRAETPPGAVHFAKEQSPLCNWRCIRLPFIVRSLACGDEHFAAVSSIGDLFVS